MTNKTAGLIAELDAAKIKLEFLVDELLSSNNDLNKYNKHLEQLNASLQEICEESKSEVEECLKLIEEIKSKE